MIEQILLQLLIILFVAFCATTILAVSLIITIIVMVSKEKTQPMSALPCVHGLKLKNFGNHILWILAF